MTRTSTLLAVAMAAVATLVSVVIPSRVRVVYPGSVDCHQGCEFVAGGWPFPYLVDHPGISPTGVVSLTGGLLGEDILRVDMLAATFFLWLLMIVMAARTASYLKRLRGRKD